MGMAEKEQQAREVLLDRIIKVTPGSGSAANVLRLAEAYAWLSSQAQPHGGSSGEPK